MTAAGPNLVGPILQAPLQQERLAQARDAEQTQQSEKSRQLAARADQAEHAVEDTDADTVVHTDAGGTGSQGRAFGEASEEARPEQELQKADQVTRDEQGQIHIDLQA